MLTKCSNVAPYKLYWTRRWHVYTLSYCRLFQIILITIVCIMVFVWPFPQEQRILVITDIIDYHYIDEFLVLFSSLLLALLVVLSLSQNANIHNFIAVFPLVIFFSLISLHAAYIFRWAKPNNLVLWYHHHNQYEKDDFHLAQHLQGRNVSESFFLALFLHGCLILCALSPGYIINN